MKRGAVSRGDALVAVLGVVLFIASFLPFYSADCGDLSGAVCTVNVWHPALFPVLPGIFLLGVAGALVFVLGHATKEPPAVARIPLPHWGTAFCLAAAWSAVWTVIGGPPLALVNRDVGDYLAFALTLLLAAATLLTPLVAWLSEPLVTARPETPPKPTRPPGQAASEPGEFKPFWFAVPRPRGIALPQAEGADAAGQLEPGIWYLAVGRSNGDLVVRLSEAQQGLLSDTDDLELG